MNIKVNVLPQQALDDAPAGLLVEAVYHQSASTGDGSVLTDQAVRQALGQDLRASFDLADAANADVLVRALAQDGSMLTQRRAEGGGENLTVTWSSDDVKAITQKPSTLPTDTVMPKSIRVVKLLTTGPDPLNAQASRLLVLAVGGQNELDAANLSDLFPDPTKVSSVEIVDQNAAALTALAWHEVHLALDSTFTAEFDGSKTIGWLWWLIGPLGAVGFVPDDLSSQDSRSMTISLPAFANRQPKEAGTQPQTESDRPVPVNYTEAELANNADVFTEDPGTYCRPFSNPERILSEKSFEVIARIVQPEIGSQSSVKSRTMTLLNLEGDADSPAPGAAPRRLSLFSSGAAAAPRASTLFTLPAPERLNLASKYVDILKGFSSTRKLMSSSHPLQWEDDISQYQATSVALGHMLQFRVRWRSNGYSLGTVAKTLTLAPRQTKRIQKIDWRRRDAATRRESTRLSDQENDSNVRERDYYDSVAANLSEWASGRSSSDSEAIAGGLGFFASGILGGIGGGAASAHSSSSQQGGRNTTASEQQRLRDAVRRHGDALRKFDSTVVTEVTQEESVEGTTEIIRNANYAHSLTVIYYQILRHLSVNTEFAGVRECLYIPFAIKPFDLLRAYRWRESLMARIRNPRYGRAFRYLKDVANNFATSDILPGTRAQQPMTYLRGSVYVSLGIERPADGSSGAFSAANWNILQPYLLNPAFGIFSHLQGMIEAARDRTFQAEYAPGIAAQWANALTLKLGNRAVNADFTLATNYKFNNVVRIDFSVPESELAGLSRSAITQAQFNHPKGLPAGSVANVKRATITYTTQRFERSVEARTGTDDLVNPSSGLPDPATVSLPLDAWEQVDERSEIRRTVQELIEHLNEHVEYYHKAIWWLMDRDRLMMMLDGFFVPNTNNVSIASIVDREPVGIIGNCLIYRVGAASYIGYGDVKTPQDLYNVYADKGPVQDPVYVSLPTDGLYAQSIMDECTALEEHYGNLDWVLKDPDPELGTLDPSLLASRANDAAASTTAPTPFPGTIISLQNAGEAPAPSGLQGALNAVTNANAFRDMAGLAGTQANAQAALNTAANLATNFGNQAAAIELAKLAKAQDATKTADQKISSIKNAVDKKLVTPEEGATAAKDVLSALNPDGTKSNPPHADPAINSAIEAAKSVPGSSIEASTPDGSTKVTLGDVQLASLSKKIDTICGFFGNNAYTSEPDLREALRESAEAERNKWIVNNQLAKEKDNDQFQFLVNYWLGRFSNINPDDLLKLRSSTAGVNYGNLLQAGVSEAQLDAAATNARTAILAAAGFARYEATIEQALKLAYQQGVNDLKPKAWSAVFVVDTVRSVAIAKKLEFMDGANHKGKDTLLLGASAHADYVREAFKRRRTNKLGTYLAFTPAERPVQVGDLINQDRRNIAIGDVMQLANIETAGFFESHADLVISVDRAAQSCITIGGNLGDSVRRRRYPLDANGFLVVSRTQLFVQEDDNLNLPNVPVVNNAAGLNGSSTGRIYALLSPVANCMDVPGPADDGTVLA